MKIVFVCYANAGRSQVAEALFNKLSQHKAESAGTKVDELLAERNPPTRTIKDATGGHSVIAYMGGEGTNMSDNTRSQLTPKMVDEADKVIVITAKESWPKYLRESGKVIFWDIPNAVGMTAEGARVVYDQVKKHVKELVDEIG
jgi:protein-tyrosine-phosphatase